MQRKIDLKSIQYHQKGEDEEGGGEEKERKQEQTDARAAPTAVARGRREVPVPQAKSADGSDVDPLKIRAGVEVRSRAQRAQFGIAPEAGAVDVDGCPKVAVDSSDAGISRDARPSVSPIGA